MPHKGLLGPAAESVLKRRKKRKGFKAVRALFQKSAKVKRFKLTAEALKRLKSREGFRPLQAGNRGGRER